MAPPPPPSINLLRALRALTTIRPVIPTHTRRNLSYQPLKSSISASARQQNFHRKLHIPRKITNYSQRYADTQNIPQDARPKSPVPQIHPMPHAPILPSPRLLARRFHASKPKSSQDSPPESGLANASSAPKNLDRGPISDEATQTNFNTMDMLSSIPPPASSVDVCLSTGFHLSNGVKIHDAGVFIVSGEAFAWKPWGKIGRNLLNARGAWNAGGEAAWGLLELVWPKPDLLILGLGPKMEPLAEETKRYLNELGVSVEVQDSRNAAAQFNLLATERGVSNVAAALVPIGWKEGIGF